MSKEAKEIREIMNDIDQIMNESYVMGKTPQQVIPEAGDDAGAGDDANGDYTNFEGPLPGPDGSSESPYKSVNIDKEIADMRQLAITLLADLNPLSNPEESKIVKSIWDSCDKFLIKDKQPKEQNNNNNNNNNI